MKDEPNFYQPKETLDLLVLKFDEETVTRKLIFSRTGYMYGYFPYNCKKNQKMEGQLVKNKRIELRLSEAEKEIFQKAQELSGDKSFSSFVVRIVKKEAEEIVAKHNKVLASERDRELFFTAVFADLEPNQSLREAAQKHKLKKA
jgi:uncharacterized protein (DUF1778 family)